MASNQSRSIDATEPAAEFATEVLEADPRTVVPSSAEAESTVAGSTEADDPRSIELSEPFVTRWTVLISTTNWEKGAIISGWRSELEAQGAPVSSYSDEAWSRRVGGVTSQHVGRLRRVYQRFGNTYSSYAGLYWTHFLAALDWDDAEMWLEGAAQSRWSVAQMRATRWEASGGDPANEPADGEIITASIDEDFSPLAEPVAREKDKQEKESAFDMPEGPRYDEPDFGDEPTGGDGAVITADADADEEAPWDESQPSEPGVSPFAALPALPVDVADALEQFKLAIIRHRAASWAEFSQQDMLLTLDALRAFALQ
jgi:hypothetical protein